MILSTLSSTIYHFISLHSFISLTYRHNKTRLKRLYTRSQLLDKRFLHYFQPASCLLHFSFNLHFNCHIIFHTVFIFSRYFQLVFSNHLYITIIRFTYVIIMLNRFSTWLADCLLVGLVGSHGACGSNLKIKHLFII